MRRSVFAIFCFLLTLAWGWIAAAHDLHGLGHKSMRLSEELNVSYLTKLADQQADPDARYVYSRLLLWNPGQTLKGCFYNLSNADKQASINRQKQLVVSAAIALLSNKNVNIAIDFGPGPAYRSCDEAGRRSDVRVSFTQTCCAAYIGRIAHHPDVKDGASVFLEGIDTYSPATAQQTIEHELMHALGFNHEHQSPASSCELEFYKERVLSAYGWTEADFQTNLKQLNRDARSYKWSSYDPKSIMKYFFEESFLKKGKNSVCYSEENLTPSAIDYDGLRDAYPMAPSVSNAKARAILTDIATSGPPAVQALARELYKLDQ